MAESTMALEWRVCKRFPAYEVSDDGRVRRIADHRQMAVYRDAAGYIGTSLTIQGHGAKRVYVHQLVCEAFQGDRQPGKEVNHINGVRGDNRAINLEWLTRAENMSREKGHIPRARATISGRDLQDADVLDIRTRYTRGGVSQPQLAREYGVTQGTVWHILNDRTWRHLPLTKDFRSMAQKLPGQDFIHPAI